LRSSKPCRFYILNVCGGHLALVNIPAATEEAPYSTTEKAPYVYGSSKLRCLLSSNKFTLIKILADLYVR
jgi:hypothetical protein